MTLADFLNYLLSPIGAGVGLWAFMAFLIKAAPSLNTQPQAKFWITFVVAFGLPTLAYGARIALGYDTFTPDGFFLAAAAGYMTSQLVHRGTEAVKSAAQSQAPEV